MIGSYKKPSRKPNFHYYYKPELPLFKGGGKFQAVMEVTARIVGRGGYGN